MTCNFVTAIKVLAKGDKRITYTYNGKKMSLTYDPEEEQFYDKDGNKVYNVTFPVNGEFQIHSALLNEKEEAYLKGFASAYNKNCDIISKAIIKRGTIAAIISIDDSFEVALYYRDVGSSFDNLETYKPYYLKDLLI